MRRRAPWLARVSGFALLTALAAPAAALAQEQDPTQVDELIITATRRAENVQDVPLNIAAVGAATIEEQGLSDLSEIAQWVPGVYIGDVGSRGSSRIVVRGLNASPSAAAESLNNDGGGTVATYVGEIPVYVDLKLNDMERVEFLLGPQGTLYGAGTLGGAIRYIPVKPKLGQTGGEVRGEIFDYKGGEASYGIGGTLNLPIGETLAIRGNLDFFEGGGFVDYNYTVQDPGVSDPDPDFTNPAAFNANLRRVPDANTEDVISARLGLRWVPNDWADLNLTYYYQDVKTGARQISQHRVDTFPVPVREFESLQRVTEPSQSTNDLISLEGIFDLGFAELTTATGYSTYEEHGRRDQTDFLIALEYSYEAFPTFTAFTQEDQWIETFTQELRLVSKGDGPFTWITGAFYNSQHDNNFSREFTPHYDAFLGGSRPDALEYIAEERNKLTEVALYGEASFEFNDRFRVTAGGRYFDYELEVNSATDLPLLNTIFGGAGPNEINLVFSGQTQEDDGFLYKLGAAFDFTDDVMGYATISQGYRIGGYNGLEVCQVPLPPGQNVCAQPEEEFFFPDKTTNYELGLKTQLMDHRLTLNGNVYYIKWEDVQLDGASQVGVAPIKRNGKGAESMGFETSFDALITDNFSMRGSFTYNQAELTADAPDLITFITPPGFAVNRTDGLKGDRLPGSPEVQASLFATYTVPGGLMDHELDLDWGAYYIGDRLTRTGNRGGGIVLPSYTIHNISATVKGDRWRASLFVDNLFDEFAETGARSTPANNQVLADAGGDPVYVRSFFSYVLPPRTAGIRFSRTFGDE